MLWFCDVVICFMFWFVVGCCLFQFCRCRWLVFGVGVVGLECVWFMLLLIGVMLKWFRLSFGVLVLVLVFCRLVFIGVRLKFGVLILVNVVMQLFCGVICKCLVGVLVLVVVWVCGVFMGVVCVGGGVMIIFLIFILVIMVIVFVCFSMLWYFFVEVVSRLFLIIIWWLENSSLICCVLVWNSLVRLVLIILGWVLVINWLEKVILKWFIGIFLSEGLFGMVVLVFC